MAPAGRVHNAFGAIPDYITEVEWSGETPEQVPIARVRAAYDEGLRMTDAMLGEFLDELRASGRYDEALIIVTSDHGENIGDHGHVDHVFSLYETTIEIPLIVHYPDLFPPGSSDRDATQLTDLFATLLRIAGIDARPYAAQGRDLLERATRRERVVLAEYYRPRQVLRALGRGDDATTDEHLKPYWRRLRSIRIGALKLIWASDGRHELYDLAHDQHEEHNLIDASRMASKRDDLLQVLNGIVWHYDRPANVRPGSVPPPLDKATLDALRSLGYLK